MTERYQGLRDALAAGPTEGPWAYEPHGDTDDYGVGVLWDEHDQPQRGRCEAGAMFVVDPVVPELRGQTNAAYIAAADPDTIRALLADYDAAVAERDRLRGALQPFAAHLSSEDTTTITVRSDDIRAVRAALTASEPKEDA